MTKQTKKQRIEIGKVGDPSSGDILYRGGEKMNENMDNVYNAFGDSRMYSADFGVGAMTIHPIGYYQKLKATDYTTPIEMGSMHDITTKNGPQTIQLPLGKAGEGVCFINTDGTFDITKQLIIRPQTNQTIIGAPSSLNISIPYAKVTLFCIEGGSTAKWGYKVESLFGDESIPVEKTINIDPLKLITTKLLARTDYDVIKFIIVAESDLTSNFKTSEVMVYVDKSYNLHWNEYSVIKSEEDILDIEFTVESDNMITLKSTAKNEAVTLTIKAIDTINKGIS